MANAYSPSFAAVLHDSPITVLYFQLDQRIANLSSFVDLILGIKIHLSPQVHADSTRRKAKKKPTEKSYHIQNGVYPTKTRSPTHHLLTIPKASSDNPTPHLWKNHLTSSSLTIGPLATSPLAALSSFLLFSRPSVTQSAATTPKLATKYPNANP
jgi:hypothetical protein